MPNFKYSMSYGFSMEPEHPMTFQKSSYDNAMCNSQKEPPAPDGMKKTTKDSADYYNGESHNMNYDMDY